MGCTQSINVESDTKVQKVVKQPTETVPAKKCLNYSLECGNQGGYGCILDMTETRNKDAFNLLIENTSKTILMQMHMKHFPKTQI